jgi:hypothetical protein
MNLNIPVFNPAPIPQRGQALTYKQKCEQAAQFRDLLVELLTEHGPLTAAQLVAYTGSKLTTVRDYMRGIEAVEG